MTLIINTYYLQIHFFVMNNPWYLSSQNHSLIKSPKPKNIRVFTFMKSVGNDAVNNKIRNKLKMFIKIINEMKYLPCHF